MDLKLWLPFGPVVFKELNGKHLADVLIMPHICVLKGVEIQDIVSEGWTHRCQRFLCFLKPVNPQMFAVLNIPLKIFLKCCLCAPTLFNAPQ